MKRMLLMLIAFLIALPLAAFDPEKPKVTITLKDGSTKEGRLDWIDENKVTVFEREASGLDAVEIRRNNVVSISFNGNQSGKFKVGEEGIVLQNGNVIKGHISGLDATNYSFRATSSKKVEKLERSKVAFIQFTKPAQSVPAPGPGPKPSSLKVVVSGRQPWTGTPLEVKEGDRLWFETSDDNFIECGAQGGRSNPDGSDPLFRDDRRPIPTEKACVLLGKVGNSVFRIGLNRTSFTMKASGKFFLGINDFDFRDNNGDFAVIIRTSEPPDNVWNPNPSPNQAVVIAPVDQPWTSTNVSVQ